MNHYNIAFQHRPKEDLTKKPKRQTKSYYDKWINTSPEYFDFSYFHIYIASDLFLFSFVANTCVTMCVCVCPKYIYIHRTHTNSYLDHTHTHTYTYIRVYRLIAIPRLKKSSLPYYLPLTWGRIVGFITFPWVLKHLPSVIVNERVSWALSVSSIHTECPILLASCQN